MSSDLDYTKTLLLVLTNAYKPELIKRYKKLFDYANGETRGDYQNAAYKQHKYVIQPLVYSNCFKKEQYENQEDLDLAIQNFDKDPDYIKMEYEGVTLYESKQLIIIPKTKMVVKLNINQTLMDLSIGKRMMRKSKMIKGILKIK
jgi:hypothetical protein